MKINGVEIDDTFAEICEMKVSRFLITALNDELAYECALKTVGFGTSIIMCPCEAGIDIKAESTPDSSVGYYVQMYHFSEEKLGKSLLARIGQCVLTHPTTAVFNGLNDAEGYFDIGKKIKYFGDGFEKQGEINGRKVWIVPRMDMDFIIEENIGYKTGFAGGNFIIMAENLPSALLSAKMAVEAIKSVEGVVAPFPIVASGSKVGSNKYKFLKASINEKFVPKLRDVVESEVPENVKAVYEIVINGLSLEAVKEAMKRGIESACRVDGVVKISAGNYGGKFGKYKVYLHELFES